MKPVAAFLFCLALSVFAAVPPAGCAPGQDANKASAAANPRDRSAGFGKPQAVTGKISMIMPQKRMIVINVADPRLATEVLQGTRRTATQDGRTVAQSDNITGVTKAPGKAQLTFEVTGNTLIRVNGERATFSDLEMSLNKEARVRFVPHRSGNVARTIDLGSY